MRNKCSRWDQMTSWPLKCKCHNGTTHEPKALICSPQQFINWPTRQNALNCWPQQMVYQQWPDCEALKKMLCRTTSTPVFTTLRFTELGTRFRWFMPKCWLNRIKSYIARTASVKTLLNCMADEKSLPLELQKSNPLTFSADGFQWSMTGLIFETPATGSTVSSCTVYFNVKESEFVSFAMPQKVWNKCHAIH